MNQDVLVQSHASVRKFGIVIFNSPFFLNGGQFIYIGHLLWFKDFFWISVSSLLCALFFSAFLLFCFSAFLLLCFSAVLLLRFSCFCFSALQFSRFFCSTLLYLLLCFFASLFFCFSVFCFSIFCSLLCTFSAGFPCVLVFLAASLLFCLITSIYKCSYNYMKNSTSSTNNKSSMYARNNENNQTQ